MSNSTTATPKRRSKLTTVRVGSLGVSPITQREFNLGWAEQILGSWDLDKYQAPHVSQRADGSLYIMEGQHGTWAYRETYGEDAKVQAWLYEGLSEQEEADFFLALNNKKAIHPLDRYKVAVIAGREPEASVDQIIRRAQCTISGNRTPGAIAAVGSVLAAYNQHGAANLARTIAVLRDSFGDAGYEAQLIRGMSMVLARYPLIETDRLVLALANHRNGPKGVIQRAALIKASMGEPTRNECTAAAFVEAYNKGRRGRAVLSSWWSHMEAA